MTSQRPCRFAWCGRAWETHSQKCAGMLAAERRAGLTLPLGEAVEAAVEKEET